MFIKCHLPVSIDLHRDICVLALEQLCLRTTGHVRLISSKYIESNKAQVQKYRAWGWRLSGISLWVEGKWEAYPIFQTMV